MLDITNTDTTGKAVDPGKAGKGRFADVTSKYQEAAKTETEEVKTDIRDSNISDNAKDRANKQASTIMEEVVKSADPSIKKRRHPAYKGERIARTYKIKNNIDLWMHKVYEGEGVTIQMQIEKSLEEYLKKTWGNYKPGENS